MKINGRSIQETLKSITLADEDTLSLVLTIATTLNPQADSPIVSFVTYQ